MSQGAFRVLLVEANEQDATLLRGILSQEGPCQFAVTLATKFSEAVEYLNRERPDIVLVDLSLPDSQGFPTFQGLHLLAPSVPMLVIAGEDQEKVACETLGQGAHDYFIKGRMDGKFVYRAMCYIVEHRCAEESHRYWLNFEKLIARISTKFINLGSESLDKGMRESLHLVGEFAAVDRAYVFMFSENAKENGSVCEWCSAHVAPAFQSHEVFSLAGYPWLKEQLLKLEPLEIPVVDGLPDAAGREKEAFRSRLVKSMMCIPLLDGPSLIGFLGFEYLREIKSWSEDTLALFKVVGEIFVTVIERKRSEHQLQKLSLAVEQSPSIVMITDTHGNIEYVNPKFTEVTGYESAEVVGKNPRILKSGKVSPEEYRKLWTSLKSGEPWRGEFLNRRKNGELYWQRAVISPVKDNNGEITHYLGLMEDITNHKWAEETIQRMAYYDPLTDLPNRMLFNDRLNQALAQAKRKNLLVAILVIDLDRFKYINDTLGHTLGDILLRSVGQRLRRCTREGDTVARLGGDEFMLLLTGIMQVEDAIQAAENILDVLKPSFNLQGHEVHITPSIGISVYPYDGHDAVTLLKNADVALNRAKEQGRTNYQLYTPIMNARAFERMTLENSLRTALEKGEFILYYQPQVDIGTGEIIGMESLIRWEHPSLGLVSPAQFIPMAEETGLIVPIGEWVLKTACKQNKVWQDMGYRPIKMSVNLSGRQFSQQNLVEMVSHTLKDAGMDPKLLDLEITESIIMQNLEMAISTLKDLHRLGIQVSIDDFGTGYSSLSYLKRFPVNTLKIAISFIREITKDPDDAAITAAVIAMAHSLKLQVVAEGVETLEQLQLLRSLGCDMMQGYLFSRPLPAQTITPLLAKGWHLGDRKEGNQLSA